MLRVLLVLVIAAGCAGRTNDPPPSPKEILAQALERWRLELALPVIRVDGISAGRPLATPSESLEFNDFSLGIFPTESLYIVYLLPRFVLRNSDEIAEQIICVVWMRLDSELFQDINRCYLELARRSGQTQRVRWLERAVIPPEGSGIGGAPRLPEPSLPQQGSCRWRYCFA
jgi:hypothetical protein